MIHWLKLLGRPNRRGYRDATRIDNLDDKDPIRHATEVDVYNLITAGYMVEFSDRGRTWYRMAKGRTWAELPELVKLARIAAAMTVEKEEALTGDLPRGECWGCEGSGRSNDGGACEDCNGNGSIELADLD